MFEDTAPSSLSAPVDIPSDFYTSTELAERLRVVPKTITAWAREERLPKPIRVGRRYLFSIEDIELWIEVGSPMRNVFDIYKANRQTSEGVPNAK